MKINSKLITALYRVLANNAEIVAWDFPPRPYKKAVDTIISFLKEKDIPAKRTVAEWPHFTLAYVPTLTEDQKHKIKLLAPLFTTRVKTTTITILEGQKYPVDFLAWELSFDDSKGVEKLVDEILKISNAKQEFSKFKPHVSLVMVDKKYSNQLANYLPDIIKVVTPYKFAYKPEQLQFWGNMNISDIENMDFK